MEIEKVRDWGRNRKREIERAGDREIYRERSEIE